MKRGFTVVEALIAGTLLGMMVIALFAGWSRSRQALHHAQQQSRKVVDAQLLFRRLEKDLESTAAEGLEFGPGVLSYLSPYDEQNFDLKDDGRLRYHHYDVLYYQASERRLNRRSLDLTTPLELPTPLSQYDFGTGVQPLASYAVNGDKLSDNISSFEVDRVGRMLNVLCGFQVDERPPTKFRFSILLRN